MKKLTLFKGRAMACLILMCLFLAQGCRKDHFPYHNPESSIAKVDDQAIDNWYKENPVSQIIGIDWSKARQTTIDGKHLVRVPILNIDKIKSVLGTKSVLKQGLLSSNGKIATVKGRVGVEENPVIDEGGNGSGNTNYYSAHPPEVYFIQDPLTFKLHTYLINFIPDNEAAGFGQGGNWTGKLYEWDTKSDTVLVQTFVNNVLTDRSVRVFYHVDENGGIALTKPQKLQSLTPIKDKQVSGIFGWLLDKILDGLGAIGSIFGLTELVPSTSSSTGHHYHYRFISHPSSPGTDWVDVGNPGSQFLSLGLPLVSSYLAGMDTGTPLVEVTYNTYDYNGINHTGGPNNNNVPNADGIYVMEYLTLSPAAQDYILSVEGIPAAKALRDYLDINTYTQENRQFASWATEYLTSNRQSSNQAFIDFLSSNDVEISENEDFNSNLNLYIPSNLTPSYSSNGFGVFTTNGIQTDTYPETHPVSMAIINYNQWVYRALIGANNTSVKHLHLNSKGLAGPDSYAKAIGAIGEGIFAQRVTTEYPTSPGGNMYIGYYINTTHIDALQEHYLPGAGGSYYGLQVNYTDIYGNPLSKKFEYPDPSHSTTLEKGRIAYEIKTNNVNRNSASTLYQTFLMGINQTVHRANIGGIDAGVLVMDYDAWKKLLNSSYNQSVIAKLNEVYSIKNDKNEQKIFLRIEKNLWSDANKAYWDIIGRIKDL